MQTIEWVKTRDTLEDFQNAKPTLKGDWITGQCSGQRYFRGLIKGNGYHRDHVFIFKSGVNGDMNSVFIN